MSESRPVRRVAVIGGGISGLVAAHRLIEQSQPDAPIDVTLFEASDRIGGVFGTIHVDDYLVETGADMFITNQPAAVKLCERLGIADELIPTDPTHRGSLVLRNGRPVRVPEGFMLLSPAKVWPVLKSPIFSPLGKLRMGLEYLLPRKTGSEEESLAAFVHRRFGREAFERLIQPLVGGIYTADPEKLSLKATMPRFLDMERQWRSLIRASRRTASNSAGEDESGSASETNGSGARYGLFTAPRHGMSVMLDRLKEIVESSGTLRTGTRIASLQRTPDGRFTLRVEDHQNAATSSPPADEQFDGVVVALRTHHAAELLEQAADAPDGADLPECQRLNELLRSIEYSSAAIVVSGHRLADIEHPLDAFGLVIPHIEGRRILAVSFTSRKFPGRAPEGRVLLRTFIGGALQPELLEQSDEELFQVVREELESTLGVHGEPDFQHIVRYEQSMPQYHLGHLDRVSAIESLTHAVPGFELVGNAYRGVGIPDCIRYAESAVDRLLVSLNESHAN
ncbi:MAG: protoporphyrinogen oxidase [Planctomycetota bacterium]|jgi:oxygen-dependent protoporphyrinogen oxidase